MENERSALINWKEQLELVFFDKDRTLLMKLIMHYGLMLRQLHPDVLWKHMPFNTRLSRLMHRDFNLAFELIALLRYQNDIEQGLRRLSAGEFSFVSFASPKNNEEREKQRAGEKLKKRVQAAASTVLFWEKIH